MPAVGFYVELQMPETFIKMCMLSKWVNLRVAEMKTNLDNAIYFYCILFLTGHQRTC